MDPRMGAAPAPNQVFEDFVPKSELVTEADADILQIHLPGNVLFLLAIDVDQHRC